jgi:hypothetical protein
VIFLDFLRVFRMAAPNRLERWDRLDSILVQTGASVYPDSAKPS